MTKEEKILAYSMRLDGASLQKIADQFGVTREYIRQITNGACNRASVRDRVSDCVYPNIRRWLVENKCSYNALAIKCDLYLNSVQLALKGSDGTQKKTIDAILKATGMTYETAFSIGDTEGEPKISGTK